MIEVTSANLGVWVEYDKTVLYPEVYFQIAVVERAMRHGYDIKSKIWEDDKLKFFYGEADDEMLEDLFFVFDYCVQWLDEEVSDGYGIRITEEGLELMEVFDIS